MAGVNTHQAPSTTRKSALRSGDHATIPSADFDEGSPSHHRWRYGSDQIDGDVDENQKVFD